MVSQSHLYPPAAFGTSVSHLRVLLFLGVVTSWVEFVRCSAGATEPLHKQIDAVLVAHSGSGGVVAKSTSDASFLRRIHLDLTGTVPNPTRTRDFLADPSPDKRVKMIDQLLESPQYARRMQVVFDVMLMERRASTHIKSEEWEDYLWEAFRNNKSWLQLTNEILTADGIDERTRPAARFMLDRELNVDDVTRDIGRMFLGRDLQCAQCHDHPAIDDYLQRHYYGIAAFIKRSYVFKDPETKKSSIGEKAEGDLEFTSVFTAESEKTSPRILDASPINDPTPGPELYKVKPEKNVRSVPVYSRRLQLAKSVTDPGNVSFRYSIANRMWAIMMGRGLVEPVDMWHATNPPTHPELLSLLADSLLQQDYDLKYLLRELALTDAYQRSSQREEKEFDGEPGNGAGFSVAMMKPLSPEQLAWSMMQVTGVVDQQLNSLIAKQDKKEDDQTVVDAVWKEKSLNKALRGNVVIFTSVFGTQGVQQARFDASADQALFLRNGDLIQRWVALKDGLSDRLATMDDSDVAQEYYVSVFARMPSTEEAKLIESLLVESKDRNADIRQLVWAGLASAEFRFNH